MSDKQKPSNRRDEAAGANLGWSAVGYLIGGIAVWGLAGWLVDKWLGWDGIGAGVGSILGAVGGIYLVFRKLSV
ncbi:MAG: AtpZ/AtpI family protein [Longispora sp.]|nr:AtpZ/AtpI family protein [Longispora sp. (in: high G+C Gram-positive bacteria)]